MRKLIATLLVLCMVLSLAPMALADEGGDDILIAPNPSADVRETDAFTDQEHADLDFEDMQYIPVTEEQFLAAVTDVKDLLDAGASDKEIVDAFHVVSGLLEVIMDNITILNIRKSADVTDDEARTLYTGAEALYYNVINPFIYLIQDILASDAARYLIDADRLTEDDVAYYESFGGISEEETALNLKLTELQDTYWLAESYDELADIYMETLETNKEIAALNPAYDNYVEYAYDAIYGRDYTYEDAQVFFDAIKEYIAPLAVDIYLTGLYDQAITPGVEDFLTDDYTTDETLAAIRPYIGRMSGELLETWDYMVGHKLYDIEYRETKSDEGFTTQIDGYGAPFFFNSPYGEFSDFTTIIHEFGHYSNFYWHPHGWNEGSCSYDVAEVHSQALELLFSQFYGDLFGDMAAIGVDALFDNMVTDGILNGALMGELEIYAYTTPDVTPEMINNRFMELAGEYGLVGVDYGWLLVPHLTQTPMYYISYATSAVGALTFWNIAQKEGYDTAVDKYLEFMSRPCYDTFRNEFEQICGVDPMDPDYIAELADDIYEALDLEERMIDIDRLGYYEDVAMNSWAYEYICLAREYGFMDGKGGGVFDPDGTAARGEAAAVLWKMDGRTEGEFENEFTDVTAADWYAPAVLWASTNDVVNGSYGRFNGGSDITRQEMAVMLYNYAKYLGEDMTVTSTDLDFTDADEISGWALTQMAWCVEHGIFQGSYHQLNPTGSVTRAALAKVVVTFYELFLADASGAAA